MSFEFMYADSWYKYIDGHIIKRNSLGNYNEWCDTICPVLRELQQQIEAIPEDIRPVVMQGLIHAYGYGIIDGKKKKIAEVKRVLDIN